MNYAQIRKLDVSNGEGLGVSLFVSGCPFHCKNCFNSEAWDYEYGNEWTPEVEDKFMSLLKNKHINRVSFLGGEPLADNNVKTVLHIMTRVKREFPHLKVWTYTGYTLEDILKEQNPHRIGVVSIADVLVDGKYVDELRDLNLKFRGSSNQRVIDVRKSLIQSKVVEKKLK